MGTLRAEPAATPPSGETPCDLRTMGPPPDHPPKNNLQAFTQLPVAALLEEIVLVNRPGVPGLLKVPRLTYLPTVQSRKATSHSDTLLGIAFENVSSSSNNMQESEEGYHRWATIAGASVVLEGSGTPFRAPDSDLDITDRKRAEEQLRRREAYLAAGERLSHVGSWGLNLVTGDLFWSEETFRIFGYDSATVKPTLQLFFERIHRQDRPIVERRWEESRLQKLAHESDYRVVLPDGSIRQVREVVFSVVDRSEEVIERHGVVADVTDRQRAEEELRCSRAELRALAARLQSAQEEERLRISRAIHDDLGEMLTGLRLEISAIARSLRRDQRDLRSRARAAMRFIDSSIIRVRKIATGLRPGLLDVMGLEVALEAQVKDFQMRTGVACLTTLPREKLALRNDQATALYRIIQESLTNIARHAQAHRVEISLTQAAGLLVLEVKDDGKGFALQDRQWAGSLGIAGMRERALALGGSMEIVSRPGHGTAVRARLPQNVSRSAGESL